MKSKQCSESRPPGVRSGSMRRRWPRSSSGRGLPSRPWLPLKKAPDPTAQWRYASFTTALTASTSTVPSMSWTTWRIRPPMMSKGFCRSAWSLASPVTPLSRTLEKPIDKFTSIHKTHRCSRASWNPGGPVFVNMVGTYGVASAGYWWGRLGSSLLRLLLRIFGKRLLLWILLFADDWLILSGGTMWKDGVVLPLFMLRVLGVPISWKKVTSGLVVSWIGLEINLRDWRLGLSERRAAWIIGWLDKTISAKSVDLGELQQAAGRFQFSFGVLVYDRPFLAPMYTLLGAYGNEGQLELPPFVLAAMHWIKRRLSARRSVPCGRIIKNNEAIFRVDAKAINKDVSIGGWEPHYEPDGSVAKHKSRWFACKLTPSTAPWAYCKGLSFKTISALEPIATVIGMMLFTPDVKVREKSISFVLATAFTDSLVSSMVLGWALTTSYPLCLIAMEPAAQMEARGLDLSLSWVPREANQEFDDLSNFRFLGFAEENRITADFTNLPFKVLPDLLNTADQFYRETQILRSRPDRKRKRRARALDDRLLVKDPW